MARDISDALRLAIKLNPSQCAFNICYTTCSPSLRQECVVSRTKCSRMHVLRCLFASHAGNANTPTKRLDINHEVLVLRNVGDKVFK